MGVHNNCKLTSGTGKLAGVAPAIVSGKPQRNQVAAHFTVTLETPDGEQQFECAEDAYIWTWPRRRELNCHIHTAQVLVRVVRGRFLKEASINQTRLSWTTTKWAMVTASLV